MKTYLKTSTSDPPLEGKGALAKHTLVCHHQGMFGCRENERKKREKREKQKKKNGRTYSALYFHQAKSSKFTILPNIGAYIKFFLG